MACQYWYNGQWRSEEEFKTILSDGLIDQLIADNKVAIEGFTPDASKLKDFKKETVTKAPITLRIVHKAQTRINNEREPGDENLAVDKNPLEVIAKAVREGAANFGFQIVIKVQGEIRTGKGKTNEALKNKLDSSEVGIKNNLEEGIPYMLIPSAYGLFPIKMRSATLAKTKALAVVSASLTKLTKAKTAEEVNIARKAIENVLYRTTVKINEAGAIEVIKFDTKLNKNIPSTFDTIAAAMEFLGDQLYRVDYLKINSGKYNETIANLGAVTTDLFSEDGNFFNSSSFVIEAYQMSENDKDELTKLLTIPAPLAGAASTAASTAGKAPVSNSPIFNAPINIANKENVIERTFKLKRLANSNYKGARVIGQIIDGKLTVTSVETVTRVTNKNASDKIVVGGVYTSGAIFQEAVSEFFKDAGVIEFKANKEGKESTTAVTPTTSKSPIAAALMGLSMEEDQGGTPVAPEENIQDLGMLLATSNDVVPEFEIPEDFGIEDLALDGDFEREVPTIKERSLEEQDSVTWDKKKELHWLLDKLGSTFRISREGSTIIFNTLEDLQAYLPQETYEMLLESRKNGKQLHGAFTNAAIYLSTNAAPGTTFHEAFHVVFNLAMPLDARVRLINEAYEKYKDELPLNKKTLKDGTTKYTLPTFLQVEELLADKFMEYTMAKEGTSSELSGEVKSTFKAMYRMVKTFFSKNSQFNIDQIFENIDLGVYKDKIQLKQGDNIKFREEDLKYANPMEQKYAFTYLNTLVDEILAQYRNTQDPEYKLTEKEIIDRIGVHKLYSAMLTRLYAETAYNKNKGKVDMANRLYKLYSILTNNNASAGKFKVGDKTILQFIGTTDLLDRFTRDLAVTKGLKLSYVVNSVVAENVDNFDETSSFDEYENEEAGYQESWMKSHLETNPRESISQRLKNFFGTIPKYTSSRKNARKVINPFGVVEKEDSGSIFKYLISKIGNSYSLTDMMAKIQSLESSKPYITHIIEKLNQDPILKTQLFVAVASKNFATFSAVYEKNGEYTVINSNRKTLDNIIKEELIANFLQFSNPIFSKENGQANFENINNEQAIKFYQTLSAITAYARKAENLKSKDAVLEIFKDIESELSTYKINITADDLESIWNPNSAKASWGNVISLLETLTKVGEKLASGVNPFTSLLPSELVNKEDKKAGRTLLEKLAKQLMPALERERISSFRNIDGKTVYNLILSGFINKQMDKYTDPVKLKEYLKEIQDDKFISELPLFKDLLADDTNYQKDFTTVLLDGLARKGKTKSVSYDEMSDIEIEATSLGMFFNSSAATGSSKRAFFKLPIPADSPTIAYIQGVNYTNEEVIDRLVDTARAEFSRIKKLQLAPEGSLLLRIPNYAKRGAKFQTLEFLNGKIDTNNNFNEAETRAAIEEYFKFTNEEGFFIKQIEAYKKKGVISSFNAETGVITFADKLIDSRVKDKTDFFKSYLLNSYYMNTQLTTMLGGDPAFYKNTVNYQKRYKQVLSPGTYTNTENQRTYYKGIIMEDSIVPTEKSTVAHILSIINSSDITQEEKNNLKTIWTARSTKEGGNNESDGATYITGERRKETMIGLGRWTDEHEAALVRMNEGVETIDDLMLIDPPFKPEKPFVFSQRFVDGTVVPTQVKNAETVLTKSFAEKKDSEGNFMYPKLAAMYADMQAGLYDSAMFVSAVKEGAVGNSVVDGKIKFSDYTLQADGSYKLAEDTEILDFKTEDWRLQQETPPHYIDERSNFGTQARNLIIADLNLEGDYTIGNQKMKGAEVAALFQDLVVEDLKTSFEEVRAIFENPDGTINYKRLSEELRKEVIDRELGQEYLDALAPITDALGNVTTTLPLYHPLIAYRMEAVMNSFFKNRVTKQKIQGGSLINTTSYGVSKNLKLIVDPESGAITFEALMPHTSKKFFPTDSNGEVDIEFIKKHAPELLELITTRIPTEDKYSMFNVRIVGFTPPAMAGTIILPVEVTSISGLDFDVDKLYFMSRAYTVNKAGTPKVIKYIDNVKTAEQATELAKNIYSNFKDFKRFLASTKISKKEQEKALETRKELLDSQMALYDTRNENKSEYLELRKFIEESKKIRKDVATVHGEGSENFRHITATIDDAYAIIDEEFLVFNEELNTLKAQDNELIQKIAKRLLSQEFDPISANSKQARDNKKIDIVQGILVNKNTAPAILDGGNFDSLRAISARVRLLQAGIVKEANELKGEELINAADDLDTGDFNINLPSTQLELFRRNMMAKKLIGVFANHNTHHAKSQYTNLQLKVPIELDNTFYSLLNQQKNSAGRRISKFLATALAAVVDNANEPISSFLNLNTFTAPTIAFLQRVGANEDTIFALVNQPVILELTQNYFNEKGALTEENNFASTKMLWKKRLEEKSGLKVEELQKISLTKELLEKNLKSDGSVEYYTVQYAVLNAFDNFYKIAKELSQGVAASKSDTTGVGPSSASNYVQLQKQMVILEKIKDDKNAIIGLEEIFWGGGAQKMIPGFTRFGLIEPINIFNKILPSIGKIVDNNLQFSTLGDIKNEFAKQKISGNLTEKEAQLINTHFVNFIASAFPFFKYSQSEPILNSMPKRLTAFKENMAADAPYKMLIDQLYTVAPNNYSKINRIEFYNTGKTPSDIAGIRASWERMLIDTDPTVKQFALDLVKYTFFSNGTGMGPYSFSNLVPVKFWSDAYQIENNIVDTKGLTFNQFLKNSLESDKLNNKEDSYRKRFIDQFIRNNGDREGFVKTISIDKNLTKTQEGKDEFTLNNAATTLAKEAKNGIVRTTSGNLIINVSRNQSLVPARLSEPAQFLKTYLKNGDIQLYEYVPLISGQKDSSNFDGQNNMDTWTYKPISNLGLTNFVLEYDFTGDINNSVLSNKTSKANTKTVNKIVDELSATDAEMRELIGAQSLPTTVPSAKVTEEKPIATLGSTQSLSDVKFANTVDNINNTKAAAEKNAELRKAMGLDFEAIDQSIEGNSWSKYQELTKVIPIEIYLNIDKYTEKEFLSLNDQEQATAIEQLKNCM